MPRVRTNFDLEILQPRELLARDDMKDIQEFAGEALRRAGSRRRDCYGFVVSEISARKLIHFMCRFRDVVDHEVNRQFGEAANAVGLVRPE